MLSLPRIFRSFQFALRGVLWAFRAEQNLLIQTIGGVVALGLALVLQIPVSHVALLVLVITFVLVLELVNTAWERTLDLVHPGLSPAVKAIKDLLAAFVFIASLGALIVGILLLGPPLLEYAQS